MPKCFRLAVASVERPETGPGDAVLDACLAAVAEAAGRGADLVVLPEEPDVIAGAGYGEHTLDDHPVYRRLAEAAARHRIGLVSTLSCIHRDGHANTGFLIDRAGRCAGIYRKKHPAPTEEAIRLDPTDGDPFPVFDFDHVRLGIAICMDIHSPEMFRIYGLKGADLVCVPTMYLDYTGDMLETLEKARAIDSQMYFALSRYIVKPFLAGKSMGYAKVIGPDGRILASTGHREGVAIADFDPKWRMPFWGDGYEGSMRCVYDAVRCPQYYGELVRPKPFTQVEAARRAPVLPEE